jgi:hypothetical protein
MTLVSALNSTPDTAHLITVITTVITTQVAIIMVLLAVIIALCKHITRSTKRDRYSSAPPGLYDNPSLCIVFKNIEELPHCTPRRIRKRRDMATVKSFLDGLGIDPTCITDTQRLGLYHPPRYLVVKCASRKAADSIVHHRGASKHISPFLAPEDLAKQDKQKKLSSTSDISREMSGVDISREVSGMRSRRNCSGYGLSTLWAGCSRSVIAQRSRVVPFDSHPAGEFSPRCEILSNMHTFPNKFVSRAQN